MRTRTVRQAGILWQRMIHNLRRGPPEGEAPGRERNRVTITVAGPSDGMTENEYQELVVAAVRASRRENPRNLILQIVRMENRVRTAEEARRTHSSSGRRPE